jgi:hypothetical protein
MSRASRGGFYHLPRYGVGARPGKTARASAATRLRVALREQILTEEGVRGVRVDVSRVAQGAWLLAVRVQTTHGLIEVDVEP